MAEDVWPIPNPYPISGEHPAIYPPTWAAEHPLKIADYARLSHTSVLPVYASTKVSDPVYLYHKDTWDNGYWAGESW